MVRGRTKLVKGGQSLAIRLPQTIIDELNVKPGEEIEVRIEERKLSMALTEPRPSLEYLVRRINARNRHSETDWGLADGSRSD